MYFAGGALLLFLYGYLVNRQPWDFGRLLGAYVACFFVVAQAIAWVAFDERPTLTMAVGGGLIVAGGAILSIR